MPKSEAFARIKRDILTITQAIPAGRLVTYHAIGAHLDVMPRHVAYILKTLPEEERPFVPHHRAVPKSGQLSRSNLAKTEAQAAALEQEGIQLTNKFKIISFEAVLLTIDELACDMPPQKRPAQTEK